VLYGTSRFITYNTSGMLCSLGIYDQTYFFLVFVVDHIPQTSFSINNKPMTAAALMHLEFLMCSFHLYQRCMCDQIIFACVCSLISTNCYSNHLSTFIKQFLSFAYYVITL